MKTFISYALVLFLFSGIGTAFAQEENVVQRIYVETADNATGFADTLSNYAPGIVGALIILVIGYFVSLLIGKAVQKRAHVALQKTGYDKTDVEQTGRSFDTSKAIGSTIRWFTFLFFVIGAVNLLDLDELSQALEVVWLWFPNVIAAIVAVIIGVMITTHASKWADESLKIGSAKQFKTFIKATVFVVIASIALTQLGIGVSILPIVIAAVSISMAIGLGFALKDIFPTVLRGIASAESLLKLGQKIRIGNVEGTITSIEMFQISVVNDKEETIIIPTKELSEKQITILKSK